MPKQIHHTFHSEIKPPMSHCFLDNMVMSSPRLHHGQSCQQHHRRIAYSDECSFSYAARCIYPTPYSVSALPYMAFSPHIPQSLISSRVGHFSLMYPARLSINASYQTEQSLLAFPRSIVPSFPLATKPEEMRESYASLSFKHLSGLVGRCRNGRSHATRRPCLLRGF
jgi:hypothetical protein